MMKKYVILIEDWKSHNFYSDIIAISKEKGFPWKNIHIFKKCNDNQVLMLISKYNITGYTEINSDKELYKC